MSFKDEDIEQAWRNAQAVEGYDPNVWRQDFVGAWIRRDFYGITNDYGWEIDHKFPSALGGSNMPDNLWAMHWKNNREKGDDYPEFKTCITSEFNKNVYKLRFWKWNND